MKKMFCAVGISVFAAILPGVAQNKTDTGKLILLEKRAVSEMQQIDVSNLDAKLPKVPFAVWFRQQVGNKAGVIWQLNECGAGVGTNEGLQGDQRACSEVNAVLPDNKKVVLMITIGGFRRGVYGEPAFFYGVLERDGEFYQIRNLSNLPAMLQGEFSKAVKSSREEIMVLLPTISPATTRISVTNIDQPVNMSSLTASKSEANSTSGELPPPPIPDKVKTPANSSNGNLSADLNNNEIPNKDIKGGAMSWANVITKVQPQYPIKAKRFNASGSVDVQVTISGKGLVTNAAALGGHPMLRDAAESAALQWVFKPTNINGSLVVSQLVITFKFKTPN